MEYFMFLTGIGLLMTSLFGNVTPDIGSRFFFRFLPLVGGLLLLATVHGWT